MKNSILIICLITISTALLQAQTATVSLPCMGEQPAVIYVPITCEAISGDVSAIEFYVTYNNDCLDPINIINTHPNFSGSSWTNNIYYEPNVIAILWSDGTFQGQSIEPGESFCTIVFDYNGIGYSDLLIEAILLDPDFVMYNVTEIDGCVGPGCFCEHSIWTGNISNDWFNTGNWNKNYVPTNTDSVLILYEDITNFPLINTSGAFAKTLSVSQNSILTIDPGGTLTTSGLFTNDGTFIILSDVNGYSGSFIDQGGIEGTGTFEFHRNITNSSPLAEPTAWHYLSSPIDGFSSDSIPDYYVNLWNENTTTYETIQGTEPCTPANPPVILNQMQSWSIKLDEDYITNCGFGTGDIIEFSGQFTDMQTGSYSFPFNYTPGNTFSGYNLLGDPYPCSIDPLSITWPDNINQSLYFWDGNINNFFTWAGGIGPIIPPTQGLFVNATGNGTLIFTGEERIHDTGQSWFKSDIDNLLTLKSTSNGNDFYDLTHIRFLEEATIAFDKEWDAYKLFSGVPGVPQIYTSTSNDVLSINAQPYSQFIQLSFHSVESGIFSIQAIETSEFSNVLLEDLFENEITDLLTESYTFEYNASNDPDRFIIHFEPVSIKPYETEQIKIWSNGNNIYIENLDCVITSITVFDLMGREIHKCKLNSEFMIIPINISGNYYLIKVQTSEKHLVRKIFVP